MLADGAPLVARARLATGGRWPRITGADLLPQILAVAEASGRSVGFLGGLPEVHARLKHVLSTRYPDLVLAGMWAPERAELADPGLSGALAARVVRQRRHTRRGAGKPLRRAGLPSTALRSVLRCCWHSVRRQIFWPALLLAPPGVDAARRARVVLPAVA